MAATPLPKINKGDSAVAVAAQQRAAAADRNSRLSMSRRWYEGLRKDLANE